MHGLGLQTPSGDEKFPKLQVNVKEAVTVYPERQVGVQVDDERVGEGQDA